MAGKAKDSVLKFWSLVAKNHLTGCWEWLGGKYTNGYARCRLGGKERLVHRWSYEHFRESISGDLDCHHVCYVRHCVNPYHLELRTNKDNVLDVDSASPALKNKNKIRCKHGHEFNTVNTLIDKNGWRYCRVCHKLSEQKRRARS